METIFLESYIEFGRCENNALRNLDLICIEPFYESTNDDGKEFSQKVITVFKNFTKNLSQSFSMAITKGQLKYKLNYIKKTVKGCPEIGKEKITIYGRNKNDVMASTYLRSKDPRISKQISDFQDNNQFQVFPKREITINVAIKEIEDQISCIESELSKSLNNLIHFIQSSKVDESTRKKVISYQKGLISNCTNYAKNVMKNIQSTISNFIGQMKKLRTDTIIKCFYKSNQKKVLKAYKAEKKPMRIIKIDGDEYYIYKGNNDDFSPAVTLVNIIIVNDKFFKYSKEVQDAIIYHEIGHHKSRHFSFDTPRDVEQMGNQFKKINKELHKDKNYPDESIDTVAKYLFKELEADKYSIDAGKGKNLSEFFNQIPNATGAKIRSKYAKKGGKL